MAGQDITPAHGGGKIHALTTLRFFAAVYVVLFHAVWLFFPWMNPLGNFGKFISLGYCSVSFFFFLSGYILAYLYLRPAKAFSTPTFYRARFARVYPLLAFSLILDSPFLIVDKIHTYGLKSGVFKSAFVFLGSAALLQAWTPKLKDINSPSWSLSVEAIFYILFPFIGAALWKLRGFKFWSFTALFYFGGQLVVLFASYYMSVNFAQRNPFLHLSTFSLGIMIASLQASRRSIDTLKADKSQKADYAVLIACLLGFFGVIYFVPSSPSMTDCITDGILAPIFAGIIWIFARPNFTPAGWLSASWMVVLGEASFGLYLLHAPMLHLFGYLGLIHGPLFFFGYLAASVGASVLSFYYFETPVRKWIVKRPIRQTNEVMERT